jgi:REP element-mobilizing transposase RayT
MPARNIIKEYGAEQYYHVYSRGVAKQTVFLDNDDYGYFLNLFRRYLSSKPENSKRHGPYPHFGNRLQLLAYCLMPNHVHMLIYQTDKTAMTELLRALMTSYSMYFNRKYDRVGPVFQSRYKASRITTPAYLEHISRYIHLNPSSWKDYPYSSLPYYLKQRSAEWVQPEPILSIFAGSKEYLRFAEDYEQQKQILDELKWELADT